MIPVFQASFLGCTKRIWASDSVCCRNSFLCEWSSNAENLKLNYSGSHLQWVRLLGMQHYNKQISLHQKRWQQCSKVRLQREVFFPFSQRLTDHSWRLNSERSDQQHKTKQKKTERKKTMARMLIVNPSLLATRCERYCSSHLYCARAYLLTFNQ